MAAVPKYPANKTQDLQLMFTLDIKMRKSVISMTLISESPGQMDSYSVNYIFYLTLNCVHLIDV